MTLARQELGRRGEDLAVRELERLGYVILARRYRTRHGEIDIVARQGECIVFVEVKTRAEAGFGSAAEAVTATKRRRVARLAEEYLARYGAAGRPCRFDVVAVTCGEGVPAIEVFRHAFDAL